MAKTFNVRRLIAVLTCVLLVVACAGAALGLSGCIRHGSDGAASPSPSPSPSATAAAPSASPKAKASASPKAEPSAKPSATASAKPGKEAVHVEQDGEYTSKEEVAAYIHAFGELPRNFVTKTKARKAGWDASDGNLQDILPGKSIGGGGFENDEGNVPRVKGRVWYECDIDYHGGYRGGKRLVYSNDGLIYYTGDHYKTYELLYGQDVLDTGKLGEIVVSGGSWNG